MHSAGAWGLDTLVEQNAHSHLKEVALAFLLRNRRPGPFLAALVLGALAITGTVCIGMSLLLHGEVRGDYLLTGSVATLVAAPPMLGMLLLVIGRLSELTAQLQRLVVTDPLTEVYNRRAFEASLRRETRRASRYGRPLSLVLLDLDSFKAVNDSLGHTAGDRVLVATVAAISSALREADQLFRIGGDEFAVLLPETRLEGAAEVGRRVCEAQHHLGGPSVPATTLSCGLAAYRSDSGGDALVDAADRALYRAKQAGGDRVETEPPEAPAPSP